MSWLSQCLLRLDKTQSRIWSLFRTAAPNCCPDAVPNVSETKRARAQCHARYLTHGVLLQRINLPSVALVNTDQVRPVRVKTLQAGSTSHSHAG
eukprot:2135376-Rhodomonas_salina.2